MVGNQSLVMAELWVFYTSKWSLWPTSTVLIVDRTYYQVPGMLLWGYGSMTYQYSMLGQFLSINSENSAIFTYSASFADSTKFCCHIHLKSGKHFCNSLPPTPGGQWFAIIYCSTLVAHNSYQQTEGKSEAKNKEQLVPGTRKANGNKEESLHLEWNWSITFVDHRSLHLCQLFLTCQQVLLCMKMQQPYDQTGCTIQMHAHEHGMPRRSSP